MRARQALHPSLRDVEMKTFSRFLILACLSARVAAAAVNVSSPANNNSVSSPVHYVASATTSCSAGVSAMGVYTAPYVLAYKVNGASLNAYLTMSPGTYNTVVQEWDNCGGATKTAITITVSGSTAIPQSKHIWIITEENRSYESVIGNPAMPYFNSLANKFGLATQYYANQHSSLPALMWLEAGQSVTPDNYTTSCFNVDNVVRHLLLKGFTWRTYQEDLPYAGFTGLSWLNYVRRHNPLIDFTDVCSPSQHLNSVPFSQLAKDVSNHATPNYVYITPNMQHDADIGTLGQADNWLSQQVPKIMALPEFQSTGDGILFVVWDEGNVSGDTRCSATVNTGCGGRVATLVIGPKVRRGFKSQILYHHQNLLRTVCEALRFSSCPGAGSSARSMADFF
jgi:phosphatidylinositol-3-phosphatase